MAKRIGGGFPSSGFVTGQLGGLADGRILSGVPDTGQ